MSSLRRLCVDWDPAENEISDIETRQCLSPENLRKFLAVLIKGRLKRSSPGQVIISVARVGLGVEMDNMFGLRWLTDKLSKLGFLFPMMTLSVTNNWLYQMIIP